MTTDGTHTCYWKGEAPCPECGAPRPHPTLAERCESVTGGGRYRCVRPLGHEGKHSALRDVLLTWSDAPTTKEGTNGATER